MSTIAFIPPNGALPKFGRRSRAGRRGSALIVALWTLIALTLLVGSMAFDMRVEAQITSHYRKRVKAQALAQAGVEWAKMILVQSREVDPTAPDTMDEDPTYLNAMHIRRGMGVQGARTEMGDGAFIVDIIPEGSRRNVNRMKREDWEAMLEEAYVPEDLWEELYDCFKDWTDRDDNHELNGAESDDPYYEERGYACKNAAVDTIDELLLIKGFDETILYGGPSPDEDGEPIRGIAQWLTTWGDGKININNATPEVLMTVPGIAEWEVDAIIEGRTGVDQYEGTRDDGYESVDEMLALTGLNPTYRSYFSVKSMTYTRVISIGEVKGVRSGIWAVFQVDGNKAVPVFWREEAMP